MYSLLGSCTQGGLGTSQLWFCAAGCLFLMCWESSKVFFSPCLHLLPPVNCQNITLAGGSKGVEVASLLTQLMVVSGSSSQAQGPVMWGFVGTSPTPWKPHTVGRQSTLGGSKHCFPPCPKSPLPTFSCRGECIKNFDTHRGSGRLGQDFLALTNTWATEESFKKCNCLSEMGCYYTPFYSHNGNIIEWSVQMSFNLQCANVVISHGGCQIGEDGNTQTFIYLSREVRWDSDIYPPSSVADKVKQMFLSAGDNLQGTEVMSRK